MKKILLYVTMMCACLLVPTVIIEGATTTPAPTDHFNWNTQKIETSGIYTYQVISESDKIATIRHINEEVENITLPNEIDGYKIVGVGQTKHISNALGNADGLLNDTNQGETSLYAMGSYGQYSSSLKKIEIPEGYAYVGEYAFAGCDNLSSVDLPNSLKDIGENAFVGCKALVELHIKYDVYVRENAFANCGVLNKVTIESRQLGDFIFSGTEIKKLILPNSKEKNYSLLNCLTNNIGVIQVGNKVASVDLNTQETLQSIKKVVINKIVVKGKKTKLNGWGEKNQLKSLYVSRGANCISWAKKNKLSYQVKICGKMGTVVKKGTKYRWKNVATKIVKYTYKRNRKKWKKSVRAQKTEYDILKKPTKRGTYRYIKTITKTSIKSPTGYIKVKPVTGW